MSYLRGVGDDAPPSGEKVSIDQLAAMQVEMLKELRASEDRRRLGGYIAIGSAVFAAFRLGVLAFPTIREKVRAREAAKNPARRRRRR